MTSTVAYPWAVRYLPAKRACTNANDIPKYEAMTDDQKKVFGGLKKTRRGKKHRGKKRVTRRRRRH